MRGVWKRGNLRSDGVGSSWVAGVLLVRALQDTLLHDNHGLDARDLRESVDRGEAARKLITLLQQITSLDVLQQLK